MLKSGMRGVLLWSRILGYFEKPFQLHALYVIASIGTRIVDDEFENIYKEAVVAYLKVVYYPRYYLERLRKTGTLDRIVNLRTGNRKRDLSNAK
jgi:hypothetical protein